MAGAPVFIINRRNQLIRHNECGGAAPSPANTVSLEGKNFNDAKADAVKKGYTDAKLSTACASENPSNTQGNKPTPSAPRVAAAPPARVNLNDLSVYRDILKNSEGFTLSQRANSKTIGHPGLHSPLNGETEAQMRQKILAEYSSGQRKQTTPTTFFLRLNDSLEALKFVLTNVQNQAVLNAHQKPGQRIQIAPDVQSRPGQKNVDSSLPTQIEAGLYRSASGFRHILADKTTLILDCPPAKTGGCDGVKDLKVVTFYPMQK